MATSDPLWDNTDQALQEACYERAKGKVLAILYLENSDQSNMEHCTRGRVTSTH
jgi:hypothetical protein